MGLLMPSELDEVFDRYPLALSVEQCAEILGVLPQQVRRRLRLPKDDPRHIPGHRPGGGKWVIYRPVLRRYIESGALGTEDPEELSEDPQPDQG